MPHTMPPEPQEGNIEYKLKLIDPTPERLVHLATQMKWRLAEGLCPSFNFIRILWIRSDHLLPAYCIIWFSSCSTFTLFDNLMLFKPNRKIVLMFRNNCVLKCCISSVNSNSFKLICLDFVRRRRSAVWNWSCWQWRHDWPVFWRAWGLFIDHLSYSGDNRYVRA